jgi:hypothetical protein
MAGNDDNGNDGIPDIIKQMMEGGGSMRVVGMPQPRTPMDPAALVLQLRQSFERYQTRCPFEPGQLVTPRPNMYLGGPGEACIVLEVLETPIRPNANTRTGHPDYMARLDMRVLTEVNGKLLPFVVESWQYELWVGSAASGAPKQ